MQFPATFGPPAEFGEAGAATVVHDHEVIVHLEDPGLRKLCTCAAGLSPQAQWRLAAVAEALRHTEQTAAVFRMPPARYRDDVGATRRPETVEEEFMVTRDIIAQLRQDITTAADTGDEAAVERLRGELSAALGEDDTEEAGTRTGTKDKEYNLIWFVENCLSNVLRMREYAQDADRAGDSELADFFRRAEHESHKGAEQGKVLLGRRLVGDLGNTTPQPPTNP